MISDVGVSVLLAWAALQGANLNVEINLSSLEDKSFVEEKRGVMKPLIEQSGKILKEVMDKVESAVKESSS